jgi:hypothetical protein
LGDFHLGQVRRSALPTHLAVMPRLSGTLRREGGPHPAWGENSLVLGPNLQGQQEQGWKKHGIKPYWQQLSAPQSDRAEMTPNWHFFDPSWHSHLY